VLIFKGTPAEWADHMRSSGDSASSGGGGGGSSFVTHWRTMSVSFRQFPLLCLSLISVILRSLRDRQLTTFALNGWDSACHYGDVARKFGLGKGGLSH